MYCNRASVLLSLLSLGLGTAYVQGNAASLVLESHARLGYDLANKLVPNWSGGALVVVEGEATSAPLVRSFDRHGEQISASAFTIPGAQSINVLGFAREGDGSIAVCGNAIDSQGRESPYLALLSPNGGQIHVIRTAPYRPYRVTIAPDGTIWTEGIELMPRSTGPKLRGIPINLSANLIRRFDSSGKSIGSFVAQSTVRDPLSLTSTDSYLVSSRDGIAWYSVREQKLVQISPQGTVRDFPGLPLSAGSQITGVAITDDGGAYVSTISGTPGGWEIWTLDENHRTWLPLQHGPSFGALYGADGDTLVATINDRFTLKFFGVRN